MISVKGIVNTTVEVEPTDFLYNLISSTGIDPLIVSSLQFDEEKNQYFYEVDNSYHGSPIYRKSYLHVDNRLVEFAKKVHEILIFMGKNKELFNL